MIKPHLEINRADGPYLRRWHLIPKNKWFNIYLHHFLGSDVDGATHNHPWSSLGIIISGKYKEITPDGESIIRAFQPKFRGPNYYHRVELINGPVWTIFITGPKVQNWGFACPKGHVNWRDVVLVQKDNLHEGIQCPD